MYTQAELINWLRDLYAMEKAMESALKKLTAHPHNHSVLREQADLHATETRRHAEALATCLKQLGSETSSLKTVLAQGMDLTRGAGASFSHDERIKDVLIVFVTAHFEIACHNIVRTGASQLGLVEIVRNCDPILFEKRRMVKWLQHYLPQIISTSLSPEEDEEDESEEAGLHRARNTPAKGRMQWEFAQMAHNASLFGGTLPRSVFTQKQS